MKHFMIALAGTALATTAVTSGAFGAESVEAAGPFDKLKKKVKKADKKRKEAEDAVNTVDAVVNGRDGKRTSSTRGGFANRGSTSNMPTRAKAPGHVGNAGPAPAKYTGQIACANLGIGNAFIAEAGEYTFSQGISTETRSGLINRRNVKPENGCFFGGFGIGDVLYVEFDKNKYNKHAYKMQCVSYDGSEQLNGSWSPRVGNYTGKDVMLHTGHSLGYTPTASGSNSSRSGAYDKHLASRGRAMTTINFAALHTDKSGTDFFCQLFDKNTGKSALALTFRRGPQG